MGFCCGSRRIAWLHHEPERIAVKKTEIQRPRYVSVADWSAMTGIGKTKTFAMLKEGRVRSIKLDKKRLIDLEASLAYLDTLAA